MRPSLLVLVAVCAACTGGRHARGDRQALFSASYGQPIGGTSLFGYVGNGDARNLGISAGYQGFVRNRWAVGFNAGYRYYDEAGGGVHAFELEGTLRYYVFEWGPVGVVIESSGGGSASSKDLPPGGTSTNWVFGFGPTFEIPLSDSTDLLFGYQWRHLSNGRGRVAGNPTQNDHRFWVGAALDW